MGGSELYFTQTTNSDGVVAAGGGTPVDVDLRDLLLTGNLSARDGFALTNALDGRVTLERVHSVGWGGSGIKIDAASHTLIRRCLCKANSQHGILLSGAGSVHQILETDCVGNTLGGLTVAGPVQLGSVIVRGGVYAQPNTIDAPAISLDFVANGCLDGVFVEHARLTRNAHVIRLGASGSASLGQRVEAFSIRHCDLSGSDQTAGTGELISARYVQSLEIAYNRLSPGQAVTRPAVFEDEARDVRWYGNLVTTGTGRPSVAANARPTFRGSDSLGAHFFGMPFQVDVAGPALVGQSTSALYTPTRGLATAWTDTLGNQNARWLCEATGTLLDNGTYDFTEKFSGLVFIAGTGHEVAIYVLQGTANAVQEVSDPSGAFSPILGTPGMCNLAYHAGTDKYRLENKRGSPKAYQCWIMTR